MFALKLEKSIENQRKSFSDDGFPTASVRLDRLDRARRLLVENRYDIHDAIATDFGHRSQLHTLLGDIFAPSNAFTFAIENLDKWMKPEARQALASGAKARVEYVPLGVVGIVGPWNFPFNLIFAPLAGVLAAGNRAILKPSELTPTAADLMVKLVGKYFTEEEVSVVLGGPEEAAEFSKARWDHFAYTGSDPVGRQIMRAAADNLTPITLELGGKSPVIVTDQFDLDEAANRIMTIKTFNGGQICLAPDYTYVPAARVEAFVESSIDAARSHYPEGLDSPDYTAIINARHHTRISRLVDDARSRGARIVKAFADEGRTDRRIAPTLVVNPPLDSIIMKEEIFGPVMPVLGYTDLDQVLKDIQSRPHPLSIFYFGNNEETTRRVLDSTISGGVTINDVMTHAYADDLPFGGIGQSGMGNYHGREGFLTFSHARSIYHQSDNQEDVMLARPPFTDGSRRFIEKAIRA
jgi:coniferyl-aldehyde dehydrogenase